jgi:hypothetical protein
MHISRRDFLRLFSLSVGSFLLPWKALGVEAEEEPPFLGRVTESISGYGKRRIPVRQRSACSGAIR